jgi:hypothetical protein
VKEKMNPNLLIFGMFVLLVCTSLSGCFESETQSSEEQRFVGTWMMEGMENTITFHSDGSISGAFGDKYEIQDSKFVILTRFAGGYNQEFYNYAFSNNDTRLILININSGVTHSLIKQ